MAEISNVCVCVCVFVCVCVCVCVQAFEMEEISLRSACSASAELEKFQMLTSDNIKQRKQQRGRRVLMQLAGTHFACFTGTKSKP
jgi:hypothetical protein